MNFALALLIGLELSVSPFDDAVKRFEEQAFTYTGGDTKTQKFAYRLLRPEQLEAGKKYPVVLFLHGAGERGDDNKSQLKYLPHWLSEPESRAKYPCFLIAPQCPSDKKWVEVSWDSAVSQDRPPEPGDQMKVVIGILNEVMKEHRVDDRRVYLTGLSMGGYGSWDLAMRLPERFAAVAPVCGGGDEQGADLLKDVPIWAWHGDADNAVPVARSRGMIEAIKKAGGSPKYSELKGVGHDSWTPAYTDPKGVVPWMFQQSRESASEK